MNRERNNPGTHSIARRRPRIAAVLAIALTASTLAACGGSSDAGTRKPGDPVTLTIYSGISSEGMNPIVAAFKKHYGEGLTLNVVSQTAGEIAATLQLEAAAGQVRADVIIGNHTTAIEQQEKFHLFETFQPPELDDPAIVRDVRDPTGGGYAIPAAVQAYLIQYNSKLVKPDEVPDSWTDLLDDRWKNKIAIGDPTQSGGAHAPLWFLTEYLKNKAGSPPYGWDYYARLAELDALLASSQGPINDLVLSGERQIGIQAANLAFEAAQDGGVALPVVPAEGAPSFVTVVSVVKDSKAKDVAEEFARWSLTADGQKAFVEGYGGQPVRTDVEAPYKLDIAAGLVPVDGTWVSKNREANQNKFREVMGQ